MAEDTKAKAADEKAKTEKALAESVKSKLDAVFDANGVKPTIEMRRKSDGRVIHVDADDPKHIERWKKDGFEVVKAKKGDSK